MTTENDPESSDSLDLFVADLRRLRSTSGNPTLQALENSTGISKTVLSEAFAGRRLPTARTIEGVITYFGADVRQWLKRREGLEVPKAVPAAPVIAPDAATAAPRVVRMTHAIVVGVVACVVVAVVSTLVTASTLSGARAPDAAASPSPASASSPSDSTPSGSTPSGSTVATGDDVAAFADCLADAKVVASETRADGTLLQIVSAPSCRAYWGRVTRNDNQSAGNSVTITAYYQNDPTGPDTQTATEPDVQGAYTTLIVRDSSKGLICASGSMTQGETVVDLGPPVCV